MNQIKTKKQGRIKSALLSWLGIPVHLTDGDFWSTFFGAQSSSGMTVNERTMLQLSTVWACARLISETIATLPLRLYERMPDGRRTAQSHPLYSLIHLRPNADTTASVHWEATVAAMLLRGAARAEKQLLGGRLVGLKFLAPDRLQPQLRAGRKVWLYTERTGRQREIPHERMFTIPGFSTDGEEGLSVIQYGANVFGSAIAADTAAAKTFENGMMPTTYFKMDRVLEKKQREEFRENLQNITGALHAGKSPLLEGGMDVGEVGINPNDAQLLESRAFSVEEICRWFRVPPWMVGHTDKSTSWGTGIEQQMIGFLTFTLMPWLRRIEQAIHKDLLSPVDQQRYYAEFAIEGLLRADSAGRAAFYSQMVNNGIFDRDEVRVMENRPPRGGNAAVLTVQSALVPLDQLGRSSDGDQVRAALLNWLSQPQDPKQE